jgi:hypothetical protein
MVVVIYEHVVVFQRHASRVESRLISQFLNSRACLCILSLSVEPLPVRVYLLGGWVNSGREFGWLTLTLVERALVTEE